MPILLDPGSITGLPFEGKPTLLVEMDLGNRFEGLIWDDPVKGLWDTAKWGPAYVTPTYPENITPYFRGGTIRRGAERELDRIEAGTADIELDNLDGRFTPFLVSSPYYPNLKLRKRIRFRGIWKGVTYPIYAGFIEALPVEFPGDVDQIVRVRLVDGLKLLAGHEISGTFPQQTSGARVAAVLDAAGWPSVETDIDSGDATVPAITLENVSALAHIQEIEFAEGGRFFMSRSGVATFRARSAGANDPAQVTWADDGTGLSYRSEPRIVFDDELIRNDIRLTREGGVEQIAASSESQSNYDVVTLSQTVQLSNDAQVLSLAEWYRDRYHEPAPRFEQLVDNAMRHQQWDQVLDREINDKATAIETRTQTAQLSSIEGITHTFSMDGDWTVTVNLAPTTIEQVGIWDDVNFGQWDTTFIWGR